jgi:hypothetical protein
MIETPSYKSKAVALEVSLQIKNGNTNGSNPIGSAKANYQENDDILSSL